LENSKLLNTFVLVSFFALEIIEWKNIAKLRLLIFFGALVIVIWKKNSTPN
jgi:hypothetical protein